MKTAPQTTTTLLALTTLALMAISAIPSALAYGKENWQIGFAGTGVAPTTGFGFGFWGWCTFGGGVTSGNNGDCNFAQYFHTAAGGGFTCHESDEISSWDATGVTFVASGTASITPTGATTPCLFLFPGSASFTGVDFGIPAAAGHYNFGTFGTLKGEFQIQVTQIP